MGRNAEAGAAQVSEPHPDATSRPDVRALGVPFSKILQPTKEKYEVFD
jgi:hypothetical protein